MNEGTLGNNRGIQLFEEAVVSRDDVLHLMRILGKPSANVTAVTQSSDRLSLIPPNHSNEKELSVGESGGKKRKNGENGTLQISVHQSNGRLVRLQQTHLSVIQSETTKQASEDDLPHTVSPTSEGRGSTTTD